jgi:flagellar basal body-associated protein FliL
VTERDTDDLDLESTEAQSETPDAAQPEPDGDATADDRPADSVRTQRRLSISISARGVLLAVVILVLAGALATVSWLYIDARHQLDTQARRADNYAHAEKTALDYAVNAATMNYQDLGTWKTKLVAGTTAELNDKLTKAAESMQQILVPLQWTSSAKPLVAKVRSSTDGIYVVDCFVSVQTKTVQAPDPLQSTATYSLTMDSTKNWQITDVGGIGAVASQP